MKELNLKTFIFGITIFVIAFYVISLMVTSSVKPHEYEFHKELISLI